MESKEIKDDKDKKPVKEDFCITCAAAIPLLLGAGTAAGAKASEKDGSNSTSPQKSLWTNWVFWVGISVFLIALFVIIYFKFINKCTSCA
jgi:hypothetical protein